MARHTAGLGALLIGAIASCATPDPSGEDVGSDRQAIIAGTPSGSNQDFVVLVIADTGNEVDLCSGSLIAPNLVLTAHHCVGKLDDQTDTVTPFAPTSLHIYVGTEAVLSFAADQPADANGTHIFTDATNAFAPDIALIQLDRDLTQKVATIRLAGGASVGETLTVVGYGITENNELPAVRQMKTGLKVTALAPGNAETGKLNDGEFVFGEAACSGDSGGPALDQTTGAVVGIASRVGNGNSATPTDPSGFCTGSIAQDVYTSLAPATTFIQQAFASASATPVLEPDPPPGDPSSDSGGCSAGTKRADRVVGRAPDHTPGVAIALAIAFGAALVMRRRARPRGDRVGSRLDRTRTSSPATRDRIEGFSPLSHAR